MTAKEYMSQLRRLDAQIRNKRLEMEDIWNRMKGVQAINYEPKEGISGTKNTKSPQEKYFNLYEQYRNDLKRTLMESIAKRKEVMEVVDSIENGYYIDLLHKRYFQYESWEQIASEMNYSLPYVYQLHGEALQEVKKRIG